MNLFNRNDKPATAGEPAQTAPPKPAAATAQPSALQSPAAPLKTEAPKTVDLKPVEPPKAAAQPIQTQPTTRTGVIMASVISKALKITGELESTEDIQIDGQIEGDVRGVGVKIGQNARVKGTVYGDEVELAGSIEGKIEAKKVILTGTARMTGDVVHQDVKIESGAYINGNLKPEMGKPDSKADTKAAPKPASATSSVVSSGPKENATAAAVHH
jgi:cytoskeletal protein CcmA (bactofilin family)